MYTHTHTHIESVVCVGGTPLVPLHTPSAHLCTPAVTGGPCLDWQRSSWINTGARTATQCGWHAGIFGHLTGIYKYKSNLHVPSAIAVVFAANTLSQKQRLKRIFGHLVKQLGILTIVRIRMPLNNQDGCLVLRDRWFTDPFYPIRVCSICWMSCRPRLLSRETVGNGMRRQPSQSTGRGPLTCQQVNKQFGKQQVVWRK